jgi:hypothetical protein
MKLELGGSGHDGKYARGDGWINMDQHESADIRHNLEVMPWPIKDGTVAEVYSCHCLEHLDDPHRVCREIARVCIVGAPVEIRVPHPLNQLAMTYGHKHVFSPTHAVNVEQYFPADFWPDSKRLRFDRVTYHPTFMLDEARRELPFIDGLSDETVMRWIPGTCHECRFFFTVAENEHYRSE